jgi:hypothetical protein
MRAVRELRPEVASAVARDAVWRLGYRRWSEAAPPEPGYTLLLPVPADLPVFTWLAMQNTLAQDPTHRRATLVIPDAESEATRAVFESVRAENEGGEALRLVTLPAPGPTLIRLSRASPSNTHFVQIHAGVEQATTTHALLHDADLFITDPGFLARHYRRCADQELACLGVSPAWDTALAEHGLEHVVATWELMFDVGWARSFPPWEHRQHHAWIGGRWHGYDTMLVTQSRTPPDRFALHEAADESFIHFNCVINHYRNFRRSGVAVEDHRFVLLLIRLLVDGLRSRIPSQLEIDLPPLEDLARGLTDGRCRVTYRGEETAANYAEFRGKVSRLIRGPLFDDDSAGRVEDALGPFDAALD